jgi:phospholipid/cholesterol/gamma-HCH transport system ATP-binding protein
MAMLDGGRIVFTGTSEEARQTRDPVVRQFIEGTSEGPVHAV